MMARHSLHTTLRLTRDECDASFRLCCPVAPEFVSPRPLCRLRSNDGLPQQQSLLSSVDEANIWTDIAERVDARGKLMRDASKSEAVASKCKSQANASFRSGRVEQPQPLLPPALGSTTGHQALGT